MDRLTTAADDWVVRAITGWLNHGWQTFVVGLSQAIPELVTLAIVICGFGVMFTGNPGKWFGRAGIAFFVGAVVRILWA